MCRNITELRGLQPPATPVEIAAAARQYVRKVSGITHPSPRRPTLSGRQTGSIPDLAHDSRLSINRAR